MTLSLSVLDVLLFLLPGILSILVFHDKGSTLTPRSIPAAGSLVALAMIPLYALLVHLIWAVFFAVNEWVASKGMVIWDTSYDPNIYKWIFSSTRPASISSTGAAYALFMLFAISLSPAIFGAVRDPQFSLRDGFKNVGPDEVIDSEEWIDQLIRRQEPDNRVLWAYVLSKHRIKDKGTLGYVGYVEKISRENAREISYIVIADVTTYLLKDTDVGAEIVHSENAERMPSHIFYKEDISTLSFWIVEDTDDLVVNNEQEAEP